MQDDIDSVIGGSSRADVDQLYDEMGEAEAEQKRLKSKVRRRREMEEEKRNRREEEKQEEKQEVFEEDESTEDFILRRLRELREEEFEE